MSVFLFAVIVLAGAVLYFLKPEERKRLAIAALGRARELIRDVRAGRGALDPLHELMLTRTKWPIVAPLLVAVYVFVWMGTATSSEPVPQNLIAWGASIAPHTTNGEWLRLVKYMFVHAGFFGLLTTIGALLSLGVVLERLVGRITFAMVFLASGIVAGTIGLWTLPATTPMYGPSGAIFGLYGLLLAVIVYGYVRQPRLPGSTLAVKRLGAGAALFVLYSLFTDYVPAVCELAGMATGLFAGLVILRGVVVRKPGLAQAALVPAAVAIVALLAALPLHGMIDARPAVAQIADVESRTASAYAKAVAEFTQGRKSAKVLVQLIDKTILPALAADRARIEALRGIPVEQKAMVEAAREYFKLREDSWHRRQAGLLASSDKILREAETTERAAMGALERVQQILATSKSTLS